MVRYEGDRHQVVMASSGTFKAVFPIGSRQPLGGDNAASLVFRTGRPARIDDYGNGERPDRGRHPPGRPSLCRGHADHGGGPALGRHGHGDERGGAACRRRRNPASASSPSWWPPRSPTPRRAPRSTGSPTSRPRCGGWRRWSPRSRRSAEVFAAVAEEVASVVRRRRLRDCSATRATAPRPRSRLRGAGTSAGVAAGTRLPLDGDGVIASGAPRATAAPDRRLLRRARRDRAGRPRARDPLGVACPIVVRGRDWGAMVVAELQSRAVPTGDRDAHRAVHRAGGDRDRQRRGARARSSGSRDEQAALRRVATLVAEGAPPGRGLRRRGRGDRGRCSAPTGSTLGRYEPDERGHRRRPSRAERGAAAAGHADPPRGRERDLGGAALGAARPDRELRRRAAARSPS